MRTMIPSFNKIVMFCNSGRAPNSTAFSDQDAGVSSAGSVGDGASHPRRVPAPAAGAPEGGQGAVQQAPPADLTTVQDTFL